MNLIKPTEFKNNGSKAIILAIPLLLVVLFLTSWWLLVPPASTGMEAPTTEFSACRAYIHNEAICKYPRPGGSDENDRVRAYLIAELQKLGYTVQLQQTTAYSDHRMPTYGHVNNIIAKLEGTTPGTAVVLVGHHDTQPHTPGAADNGIALATMLETAAVFANSKPLQNDLVLLFTDSEEFGLLGASAFVDEHPLMDSIGILINLEARGNSGPVLAFEVSEQNGWIIREFIKSVKRPVASSLMYEIYNKLPNSSDFTIFKEAGLSGFNLGIINGFVHYHNPTDRPEHLNIRSLQHMGDYTVDLVSHFGNLQLNDTDADDLVYFNLIGHHLIYWPVKWNLVMFVFIVFLFVVVVYNGFKSKQLNVLKFVLGFISMLVVMLVSLALTWGLNKLVLLTYPYYSVFYFNNFFNAEWYFAAYITLVTAVFMIGYHLMARHFTMYNLITPVLLVFLLLSGYVMLNVQTATYLFFVPLLFTLSTLLVLHFFRRNTDSGSLIYIIICLITGIPLVFMIGPTIILIFTTFGLEMVVSGALFTIYLLLFLLPLLYESIRRYGHYLAAAFMLSAFVFIGIAHTKSAYSIQQPLQSNLMYAVLDETRQAYWLSSNLKTDEWNQQFFVGSETGSIAEFYPGRNKMYLKNQAPFKQYKKPVVSIQNETLTADNRQLSFILSSENDPFMIELIVPVEFQLTHFSLNGIAVSNPNTRFNNWPYQGFRMINPSAGENLVTIEYQGAEPIHFSLIERIIGLPKFDQYSPMPPYIVPDSDYESSMTLVKHEVNL